MVMLVTCPVQADALNQLTFLRVLTGDYPAATASARQALAVARSARNRSVEADALIRRGLVQQLTADYLAAAASQQQALALFRDRLGQAEALNRLGELATRTSATGQARKHHAQALAIARDISAAPEEARALEGIGLATSKTPTWAKPPRTCGWHSRSTSASARPRAPRVEETLQRHGVTSTIREPQPPAPSSEGNRPRAPSPQKKPSRDKSFSRECSRTTYLRGTCPGPAWSISRRTSAGPLADLSDGQASPTARFRQRFSDPHAAPPLSHRTARRPDAACRRS